MAITATIITLSDNEGSTRDVFIRGDAFNCKQSLRHLDAFIRKHTLHICDMVAYQQPTFAQSIHYHLTGEAI